MWDDRLRRSNISRRLVSIFLLGKNVILGKAEIQEAKDLLDSRFLRE
jgi:hypothetical protein